MATMTSQECQALITGWMRERMEQGYTALEAHSYALHQLGMLENRQAEAERENRRQAVRKLEEARKNQP